MFKKMRSLFLIVIVALPTLSFANQFSSDACFKASFSSSIKGSGRFFGLIKNELHLKKEECLITVTFDNILTTVWMIDLCREPIHLKVYEKGSDSFYKRRGPCRIGDQTDDFCNHREELHKSLLDYGLIYAKGERESLDTEHGRAYCSHLLLKKHLDSGIVFSKYKPSVDLFEPKKIRKSSQTLRPMNPSKRTNSIKKRVEKLVDELPGLEQKKNRF